MRDKGFTLIELLAVIVILAIIALIAVPIVINIINDSKTSSDEQSVELYLDTVEKIITKKQLSNPNFNPDKCEIQDNGDLECYKNNQLIDTLHVEMKGKMPVKGTIELRKNNYVYKNIWLNGKKYYPIAVLLSDADNNNEISIGDKYSYKVNDDDTFNFYVLTNPVDGKVNLIMDKNICEDGTVEYNDTNNYCRYPWHAGQQDNNYGPDTVMTAMYNATKYWINVPDMIMDCTDSNGLSSGGFISITTDPETKTTTIIGKNDKVSDNQVFGNSQYPLKARLPRYDEARTAGCSVSGGSCYEWMVDNKTPNTGSLNDIYGYWTMNSYSTNRGIPINFGRYINYSTFTNYGYYGIRPVITVPISDLE